MTEWLVAGLAIMGASFLLVAAIGVVRMPDLFSRVHAATKAGPVGIASIVLGVVIHLARGEVTLLGFLLVAFLLLTAPVAAHLLSRAGYLDHAPLWPGTIRDDLRSSVAPAARAPERESHPDGERG